MERKEEVKNWVEEVKESLKEDIDHCRRSRRDFRENKIFKIESTARDIVEKTKWKETVQMHSTNF